MKKVLITGGATGIGKSTAMLFAQKGYDVFVTYNQTKPDFDGVTKIKCNLENEEDILNLFKTVGNIDILVNNAGISLIKQINDTTAEEYDKIMSVNARSYFLCSREAIKLMLKNHEGAIVNVSSMWGQTGASCEIAYSMSKAAVIGLTRSLAEELAPSGIAVNAIAFGAIDTAMNGHLSLEEKTVLEEEIPFGRMATEKEAADFIVTTANAGSYLTGQVLTFDGGWQ